VRGSDGRRSPGPRGPVRARGWVRGSDGRRSPGPPGPVRARGWVRACRTAVAGGRGEGGTARRTIFGVWRSSPNFRRARGGSRRGSGASVAFWGLPVTLIGHVTAGRLGGRRRMFDVPAPPSRSRRRSLEPPARRGRPACGSAQQEAMPAAAPPPGPGETWPGALLSRASRCRGCRSRRPSRRTPIRSRCWPQPTRNGSRRSRRRSHRRRARRVPPR
jgi:hypothetical protein